MHKALVALVVGVVLSLLRVTNSKEFCSSQDVPDWQAYIMEAHWGNSSQLRLDYRRTFQDVYQPRGYCVCDPGVPMEGWLYLTDSRTCKEMFEDLLGKLDTSKYVWPPPKEIPTELYNEYSLDGRVQISNWYFSQQYNKNPEPHKWTKEVMEGFKSKAMKKEEFSYGAETNYIYDVLDQFSVAGDMGIVLGSEAPWIEGILLAKAGKTGTIKAAMSQLLEKPTTSKSDLSEIATIPKWAKKLTTVEYQEIASGHPDHNSLTPRDLASKWLSGSLPEYDFAVSYSSYEHDGLGRYGDPIDPVGDIWDVRRISCFVRPGGYLFLGVPMGPDQVVWNAHRIYGPFRLPLLTANFELVGAYDEGGWVQDYNKIWSYSPGRLAQPLLVLKNRRLSPCQR